ncbi:hypothetical protein L9F63_021416, partial [Diploptera punctata]
GDLKLRGDEIKSYSYQSYKHNICLIVPLRVHKYCLLCIHAVVVRLVVPRRFARDCPENLLQDHHIVYCMSLCDTVGSYCALLRVFVLMLYCRGELDEQFEIRNLGCVKPYFEVMLFFLTGRSYSLINNEANNEYEEDIAFFRRDREACSSPTFARDCPENLLQDHHSNSGQEMRMLLHK